MHWVKSIEKINKKSYVPHPKMVPIKKTIHHTTPSMEQEKVMALKYDLFYKV